jgi:hypothetical protein
LGGITLPFTPQGRYIGKRNNRIEKIAKQTGNPSFNWFFISPVYNKFITYDKLFDGSLTLYDIFIMNEAIDYIVDLENNIEEDILNGK